MYIGWVPTVGGRLSFSIIGYSTHPTFAEVVNIADDSRRKIVCLQQRSLLDSAIPFFKKILIFLFCGWRGTFYFLLDAESSNNLSDSNQSLTGKIYLFPEQQGHFYFFNRTHENISLLRNSIMALGRAYNNSPALGVISLYDSEKKIFLQKSSRCRFHSAKFSLDRDGVVEIHYHNADPELEHIICAQLFFFLKDISHKHQHHHPKTDTIVDIYNKNNSRWQDETLRSLYKKVLDFKRRRDELVCSSALGVLSYIKSFRHICEKRNLVLVTGRDDDNLCESIRVSQDELRHITAQNVGLKNAVIVTFLAILGVLLMSSALVPIVETVPLKDIKKDSSLFVFVVNHVMGNPFRTSLVALLASVVYSAYTYYEYLVGKIGWFKNIVRILQSIRSQVISGGIMIALSMSSMYLVYLLFGLLEFG